MHAFQINSRASPHLIPCISAHCIVTLAHYISKHFSWLPVQSRMAYVRSRRSGRTDSALHLCILVHCAKQFGSFTTTCSSSAQQCITVCSLTVRLMQSRAVVEPKLSLLTQPCLLSSHLEHNWFGGRSRSF